MSDTIEIPSTGKSKDDEYAPRGQGKGCKGQVPKMVLPSSSRSAPPFLADGCALTDGSTASGLPEARGLPPGRLQLFTWLLPYLLGKNKAHSSALEQLRKPY